MLPCFVLLRRTSSDSSVTIRFIRTLARAAVVRHAAATVHNVTMATAAVDAAAAVTADPAPERVRFYYLDKRVKGEAIRLALVCGGIDFEDVRVSYDEVAQMRSTGMLPFSQVPAMDLGDGDGTLHAQSQGLLRWAGKKGGLYPDEHQLRIDAVTDTIVELYSEVIKVGYGSVMTRHPATGRPMVQLSTSQRMQVAQACGQVLFPTRFNQLERLVATIGDGDGDGDGDSTRFFCGEQLTIADLSFYVLASAILESAWEGNGVGPESLDGCDRLLKIVKLVGEHPPVAAWNAAHPAAWFG